MTNLRTVGALAGLLALSGFSSTRAAETNPSAPLPPFAEVYDLVRSNLTGATEADLNRAAVLGFIRQLQPQVRLVTNGSSVSVTAEIPLVTKGTVFDGSYGFVRIGRVAPGLAAEVKKTYGQLASTNKLKGLIVDLRYALGQDYTAAAETADLFYRSEQPLLQWGGDTFKSKSKSDAIDLPFVVLVNHETTGAAEALAAALRAAEGSLTIGSPTAGQAHVYKEFPLGQGESMRVASVFVAAGDGLRLPDTGLQPDIRITVNPEDEKAFFEDPYKVMFKPFAQAAKPSSNELTSVQSTNRNHRRLNEAELVRMQRDGMDLDVETLPPSSPQTSGAVMTDPALSRGLDLLKGLALALKRR